MNQQSQASKEYLRNAVLTATPAQLQLMLYDGGIRFAEQGKAALANKDYEAAFNALERAQRIVLQLSAGLRREVNPQLCDQMASLYNFIYRRLIEANVHHSTRAVDEALMILRHQRETWVMLMERLAEEAGGGNADASDEEDRPALSVEG
ncbi:MAG: flagellar export chaperone FliS [Planctomycetota bacterium]|nr:MAG: flagellar export chaperone FliS [Planctomycetota bacterium]